MGLVHRLGERPGAAGPVGGHHRVGGGTHEVHAGVAHGLDSSTEASSEPPAAIQSVLPSIAATQPSSETDIFRSSEAMRCFRPGMDDVNDDMARDPVGVLSNTVAQNELL